MSLAGVISGNLSASEAVAQAAPHEGVRTDHAAEAEPKVDSLAVTRMTGDWGGARQDLADDGIDLSLGYTGEFAANVSGGARKDATENGQFTFGLNADTDKLMGLKGGTFQFTVTYRHGKNLSDTAGLGTLQQVQEIYGRGQTWRLTELWYQQELGGGVDLKLGRMVQGGDFSAFSCQFENLSFCGAPVGNLAGDYWYNWPVAQWGARLRVKSDGWYAMAGAYENNPHNLENDFALSHGGATGVLIPAEIGLTPASAVAGLPGKYRLGAWYNTSNADDVLNGTDGRPFAVTGLNPIRRNGRYGVYFLARQQLTGSNSTDAETQLPLKQGLSVFFNVTQTDRKTQRTDNQVALGLFYNGPFGSRPYDEIGLAAARTNVNARATRSEVLATPGSEYADAEYAVELYYGLAITQWLVMRPNVQYIIDPGGYSQVSDVVVLGLKSSINF